MVGQPPAGRLAVRPFPAALRPALVVGWLRRRGAAGASGLSLNLPHPLPAARRWGLNGPVGSSAGRLPDPPLRPPDRQAVQLPPGPPRGLPPSPRSAWAGSRPGGRSASSVPPPAGRSACPLPGRQAFRAQRRRTRGLRSFAEPASAGGSSQWRLAGSFLPPVGRLALPVPDREALQVLPAKRSSGWLDPAGGGQRERAERFAPRSGRDRLASLPPWTVPAAAPEALGPERLAARRERRLAPERSQAGLGAARGLGRQTSALAQPTAGAPLLRSPRPALRRPGPPPRSRKPAADRWRSLGLSAPGIGWRSRSAGRLRPLARRG